MHKWIHTYTNYELIRLTVYTGDISPITTWGRVVAVLTCWTGVPMFAAIIGIFRCVLGVSSKLYVNGGRMCGYAFVYTLHLSF